MASQQTWPVWKVMASTSLRAVWRTLTSSKTTAAPLPPSSSLTGTRLRPQAAATSRPTSGEPVNDIRFRPGWAESAAPVVSPRPGTTLITPSGMPTSLARQARYIAESGVSSAGLITTVLPAARAGEMPQPISRKGKFQGKMKPQGPQGLRTVQASCPATASAERRWTCSAMLV